MAWRLSQLDELGIRIQGYSLAGEETVILLPELSIAFDVGRAPRELLSINHVFLSHGHMDHAAGVAYYFSQRAFIDNAPGSLYVPRGLERPIRELLRLWGEIDGNDPPANIVVAEPLVDIPVRKDLVVRPFEVNHGYGGRRGGGGPVRPLGYAVIEVRHKLLEEYLDLSGPQIVELKRQGIEITRRVEMPLVCYCGDTAPGDFFALDFVRQARILLLECTFFDPEHRARARAGNHMHVSDLRRILPTLANERIVLCHLTRRTALAEAKRYILKECGSALAEHVIFLMDRRRSAGSSDAAPPEDLRDAGPETGY